jgi:hypothetical protein
MRNIIHASAIGTGLLITVLLGGCTVEYTFGGVLEPVYDPRTGEEIGLYDAYEEVYYLDDGSELTADEFQQDERCSIDDEGRGDGPDCGCDADPDGEIEVGVDLLCRGGACVTPIVQKMDDPDWCFLCLSCEENDLPCQTRWCPHCHAEPF